MKSINKAEANHMHAVYHVQETQPAGGLENASKMMMPERLLYRQKKTRLLVKRGVETIVLRFEDIVLIYSQNKLAYVIDQHSKKYISGKNLSELALELDNAFFFRANRQYMVNINYLKSFKPYDKVKLLIHMSITQLNHSIIISQEMAPSFKRWMEDV